MARALVAEASSPFAADEALRAWVEEGFGQWDEHGAVTQLQTVWGDLVQTALRQVDWVRLTQAFSE